ncbi:hypothetical protein J0383_22555 [Flavobacterium endoglycinae]|uniref:Uncharacterized protein n=1 Tax=Flavobacterium endoglycinae TaxID=2816357 RepID=A0ABX7QE57_9FLAO|nr:hypothetical protein [Flavobacterium endoglycinae]QSW89005.1 hypothetical protein J0383_22555 [Flavobacterium endoglycinae]
MKKIITSIAVLLLTNFSFSQQIGDGYAPAAIQDFSAPLNSGIYNGYYGTLQNLSEPTKGVTPDVSNPWQHLLAMRHIGRNNNYQLQIGSSFTVNDRLFFRKIVAGDLSSINTSWVELATRGVNTFTGNQIISGNVGVGTSNPRSFLDVAKTTGNGVLSTVFARLAEGDSVGDGTFLGVRSYNTSVINGKSFSIEHSFYNITNSSINFLRGSSTIGGGISFNTNNNKEQMIINSNGYVGIGITNPKNHLDVNGTIHSKEVKVDMTGWSDFVFKKEYTLPTLAEVENHIKEKGHLENIPSEEEVLKNGINLGEINAKLLQKIEELTLYSIQQAKEIEALKEENKSFKALSERLSKIEEKMK